VRLSGEGYIQLKQLPASLLQPRTNLSANSVHVEHRCKKKVLLFYFGHVFKRFLNVFFNFPNVFYLKKTLAKFRTASRLTRSTFKITATKQTYDFLLHVE